jgi:hypothetical protein
MDQAHLYYRCFGLKVANTLRLLRAKLLRLLEKTMKLRELAERVFRASVKVFQKYFFASGVGKSSRCLPGFAPQGHCLAACNTRKMRTACSVTS